MRDLIDTLIEQLDKDQPRWYLYWATSMELLQFSESCVSGVPDHMRLQEIDRARSRLKHTVAMRLFHRILNSALSAGIIAEPSDAK